MKLAHRSDIVRRLHCPAGHLEAVIQMAESDTSCEQVVFQLSAVDAALRAAGIRMILAEVQESQSIIIESSSEEVRTTELQRLHKMYKLLLQYSNHHYEVFHE